MSPSRPHRATTPRSPRHGTRARSLPAMRQVSLAVCLLLAPALGRALPEGGAVVSGDVTITTPSATPGRMDIAQTSARAIVTWDTFSIAAGERVSITQPSSTSVLLNRVTGNDASRIFGALSSNGNVWLINPRGIVFGAGSQVDVGGLVASTLSISGDPFGSRLNLRADADPAPNGSPPGLLQADGSITATSGSVVLVAPQVQHGGLVTARRVGMAAATELLVDVEGDGLIFFNVRSEGLDARLAQLGTVRADGGAVELRAAARAGFADTVLNLEGVVQARSIGVSQGRIVIDGGSAGTTRIAGRLDAGPDPSDATTIGGTVQVQGETLRIERAAAGTVPPAADLQGGSVTLTATRDITVASDLALATTAAPLTLSAGRDIRLEASAATTDGEIVMTATAGQLSLAAGNSLSAGSGAIRLTASGGDVLLDGRLQSALATGTAIEVVARDNLRLADVATGGDGGRLRLAFGGLGTQGAGTSIQAGNLLKDDAGTLVLSQTNAYAGGTTVQGGSLRVAGTGASAGGGAIDLGGNTLDISGGATVGNALTVADGARVLGGAGGGTLGTGADVVLGAASTLALGSEPGSALRVERRIADAAGDGRVRVTGGLVTLLAANGHGGGTTVDSGTLRLAGATASAGSGPLALGANTLDLSDGATLGAALTVEAGAALTNSSGTGVVAGTAALAPAAGGQLTLSSTGDGLRVERTIGDGTTPTTLRVAGGLVTMSGASTQSGDTTVAAGTLQLVGPGAVLGGGLVLEGGTLDITTTTLPNAVRVAGTAALISSSGGGRVAAGAALGLDDGALLRLAAGTAGSGGTLSIERALTDSAGNGRLVISEGRVVLAGAASHGGATQIDAGATLVLGAGGASGSLGTGAVVNDGVLRIERDASATLTLAGAISGNGRLEQAGPGTTVLTGANSYGDTQVLAGALQAGAGGDSGSLGRGAVTLAASTQLRVNRSGTLALAGPVSGDGSVQLDGGTLVLQGAGSYTGGTTVNAGTLRVAGAAAAAGTGTIALGANTLDISDGASVGNLVTLASGATLANSSGSGTLASQATPLQLASGATLTLSSTGERLTLQRGVQQAGPDGTLVATGTGSVTLQAASSGLGTVRVAGGSLELATAGALPSGAALVVDGGTLALGTQNLGVASVLLQAGAITSAGGVLGSSTAFDLRQGSVGAPLAGAVGLVKSGTGTVTLSAPASYTGSTRVEQGSLALAAAQALPAGTALTVAGGTLDIGSSATSVATLTLQAGSVVGTSGVLSASRYTLLGGTVAGSLGAGVLEVRGDARLAASAAASTVQVESGTLTLGAENLLADAAQVSVAAGASLALGGSETVGTLALRGRLAGTGTLTAATTTLDGGRTEAGANLGAGSLRSDGSSTLAGASAADTLELRSGTLTLEGGGRLAAGTAVQVASTASLLLGGNEGVASLALAGRLAGQGVLSAGSYTLQSGQTQAGADLGTGLLTASGSSSLGGRSAASQVQVQQGTLALGDAGRLGAAAAVSVATGASLALAGNEAVATLALNGGTLAGSGTLAADTATLATGSTIAGSAGLRGGTVTVTGDSLVQGTLGAGLLDISAGRLDLPSAGRLVGAGTVQVASGASLRVAGSEAAQLLRVAGQVQGPGSFSAGQVQLQGGSVATALGAGSLVSSGNSSLAAASGAGVVRVDDGVLTLAPGATLAPTAAVQVAPGAVLQLGQAQTVDTLALAGTLAGTGRSFTASRSATLASGAQVEADLASAAIDVTGNALVSGRASSPNVRVQAGTLRLVVANRLAADAAVSVARDATLALEAPQSVGTLALAGTLAGDGQALTASRYTLQSGATVNADLGRGQLDVDGDATLRGTAAAQRVNVNTGTLTLARGDRLADDAAVLVRSGATLTLNGDDAVGSVSVSGTVNGTGRLNAAATVLDDGSYGLDIGAGTLISRGQSRLVGQSSAVQVRVESGSLTLASAGRLVATPGVDVAAGALLALGGDERFGALTGAGSVALGGATLSIVALRDSSFGGSLQGAGSLLKLGTAAFTLAGANSYTGSTRVQAGELGLSGTLASTDIRVEGGVLATRGAERLADTASVQVASGARWTLTGNETVGTLRLAGVLDGQGVLTAPSVQLDGASVEADLGAGTLRSDGSSSLRGRSAAGTVQVASGTLTLAAANRLAETAQLTVQQGATLALAADNRVGTATVAGTLAGAGTLAATRVVLDGGNAAAAIAAGELVSRGSSRLAGTATAASVSVESGELALAAAQRLASLPAVQVQAGARLALGGDEAVGALTGSGAVALGAGTLTAVTAADSSFAGVVGGSGGLVKQGGGRLTLTGANTYTGSTRVDAGSLRLGDGGSTGSLASSALVVDGRLVLARADALVLAQAISGRGVLEQAGSGQLSLAGANKSYTGGTVVTNGSLVASGAGALPAAGDVTVAAGGRLTLEGTQSLRSLVADGTVLLGERLLASGDILLRGPAIGQAAVALSGSRIEATNEGNQFSGSVSLEARGPVLLSAGREAGVGRALLLGSVQAAAGGRIEAGSVTLSDLVSVTGGRLELVATATPAGLAPDDDLSGKLAAGLPMAFAADTVQQTGGRLAVAAGAELAVLASGGGSVQLQRPDNSALGGLSIVSGTPGEAWSPNASTLSFDGAGGGLYALQSRIRLGGGAITVGPAGLVADVVQLRADRVATPGTAVIVARLPYDIASGRLTAFPALTLEFTPAAYGFSFPFGASGPDAGLRVSVGSRAYGNRTLPLDAGFVAVLPRSGAPATAVVLLAGPPVDGAGYRFYFDGAGNQSRIPVYYNGALPTTPQVENSLSATVSVSEGARKERFDDAVRTENVAIRLRAGVIAEVGPAAAVTQGPEGMRLPSTCAPQAASLACAQPR